MTSGWGTPTPTPDWGPPVPPPPGWGAAPSAPGLQPDLRPGVVPLRPLGVGEIIDGSISIIRRHWKIQLGLSAAVVTVVSVLQAGALYLLYRDTDLLEGGDAFAAEQGASGAANAAQIVTLGIGQLAQMVLLGVLAFVAGRAVLGEDLTAGQAWAAARPHLWRLLGLSAGVGALMLALLSVPILLGVGVAVAGAPDGAAIAAGVGTGIAAVATAAWLWVRLGLAAPALVLERATIPAAMRRSSRLVKGHWWRTFGLLLLAAVISGVLGSIIATPFTFGALLPEVATDGGAPDVLFYVLTTLGSALAGTITYPFTAGVAALVYIDLRMRREALDLTLVRSARAGTR